jgi:hypothetical protein
VGSALTKLTYVPRMGLGPPESASKTAHFHCGNIDDVYPKRAPFGTCASPAKTANLPALHARAATLHTPARALAPRPDGM